MEKKRLYEVKFVWPHDRAHDVRDGSKGNMTLSLSQRRAYAVVRWDLWDPLTATVSRSFPGSSECKKKKKNEKCENNLQFIDPSSQ